jgi:curved DNA-binding protein CbpA
MSDTMQDPHVILQVAREATMEQVRTAYLELVRQFPPDRAPEKFKEIHAAYKEVCDPLAQASGLFKRQFEKPNLEAVIDMAEKKRPRFSKGVLLALGNG